VAVCAVKEQIVGINTRDLASLAALGVLGYGLMGRGKKSDVPVEDRKGVPVEQILRSADVQTIPEIRDDTIIPEARYGSPMDLQEPGEGGQPWKSIATTQKATRSSETSSKKSMLSPGEAAAKYKPRRYNPSILTPEQGAANYKPRRIPEASSPSKVEKAVQDTGDEVARPARRVPRTYGPQDIPTGGYPSVAAGESASGSELGRNVKNTLAALGPGKLAGVGNIATEMATAKRVQDAYNARAASRRAAEGFSPSEAIARRRMMEEAAFEGGMKRGGKVKKMASGGAVRSTASKRADGIAQRGKTKGKFY
jgi:hypothetical protein